MNRSSTALLFLLVMTSAFAQRRQLEQQSLFREDLDRTTKQPTIPTMTVPAMDAPLDGKAYIIGPGDIFTISIGLSTPVTMPVTVGADGMLVIPTVGEVTAGGRSLETVREDVRGLISRKFIRSESAVSLSVPRRVLVRVSGTAVREGTYESYATDRVSALLARTDVRRTAQPVVPLLKREEMEFVKIRRRSVVLRRSGGTSIVVDLDQFGATGKAQYNPYLSEGDEVIANAWDDQVPSVSVGGAVNVGGVVEYRPGDRVVDLVAFARGVTAQARPDSIVLSRNERAPQVLNLLHADSSVALLPGDRVLVPSVAIPNSAGVVSVTGEVLQPGSYPIAIAATRLSDVVTMAGGVTAQALLDGATLTRQSPPGTRYLEDFILAQRGNVSIEDTSYISAEAMLRSFGDLVSVSFSAALSRPHTVDDPYVWPGDRIEIPRRTMSVYVFGAVRSPGHVAFTTAASIDDYVGRAGGFTDKAKKSKAMVIKRGSRQWLSPEETTIQDGDFVWVPKKVERDLSYDLMTYAQIAGILSAITTIVLVFANLSK